MSVLIYLAIPVFVATMLLESRWARRARGVDRLWTGATVLGYARPDTRASLAMGVGNVIIASGAKIGIVALWAWLYARAPWHLPVGAWWTWLLLFVAEDFCYYWYHRSHHEVRVLWATHVNHHSSERYNLSTALRQAWLSPFSGIPFWLPLPLLGFHPGMVLTQQAVSLLYQYWIHTEAIGRFPAWFEWLFNTPSHHRVHHGANPEYLDRNHGGILIVWDRLFGTFEPERAPVHYGLTKNIDTYNPFRIAFHEVAAIARDVRHAPSLRAVLGYLFAPPGWSPEGGGTASELRAAAARPLS